MRPRGFWAILILILFTTPGTTPSQAHNNGLIEVTLILSGTTMPVSGATITLQSLTATSGKMDRATGTTDKNGQVTFRNLPPGRYSLSAQKEGYVENSVSPALPGEAGMTLIQPEQPLRKIVLYLTRAAAVSGKLTDADGSPVPGARVSAGTMIYQGGRRKMNIVKSEVTDARGQYRIATLRPDAYYIFADFPQESGSSPRPDFFPTVYYPGTIDVVRAKPLVLNGGDQPTVVDLMRQKVKTYVISGEILEPPEASISRIDFSTLSFFYAPRDPNNLEMPLSRTILNRIRTGSGAFNIAGIPPGSWNLFALMNLPNVSAPAGFQRNVIGSAAVDITDRDVSDVMIQLVSGKVKGRLTLPSGYPAVPGPFSTRDIGIMLQPRETVPGIVLSQRLGPDSDFEFSGVPPGKYSIIVSGVPPMLYVEDIRVGTKSIFNDGVLTVGPGPLDPIRIVLAAGGAMISGTIAGLRPEMQAGQSNALRVVLAPMPARRGNTLLYRTMSLYGLVSNFGFFGIPPGEYKIFAFQGLAPGFEQDPAVLARHEKQGRAISVKSGQSIMNFQVELITDAKASF